ncbi:MAG TPA: secretin and TonB N-terminal domain-containing protein, partial [Candidatus Omnitrophota bacterium]|nr:secretin and TonB N-terminal domain-containing protein [Candidatus Omnitrophota bacterium]
MRVVMMFLLWGFILFMPQKVFSQPAGAPLPGRMDDAFKSPGQERPEAVPRTMQNLTVPAGQFPSAAQNAQPPNSISGSQTTKPAPGASGGTPASSGSTTSSTKTGESEQDQPADQETPFVEIKKLSSEANLFSLELRNVDLADLFRIVAHDYKLNILIDKDIKGTVTASLSNISLEEALDQIARMNNIILEKQGNVILVKSRVITKIFVLKNIDARVI